MNLLTRADFDGLICAVLLKEAGIMDSWKFVHPKDVQDGKVDVTSGDILANVPYVPGCGMWFDHHSSETERLGFDFEFEGASKMSPSCARVIWEYFGGHDTFAPSFDTMLEYVDRCDSGQLTREEVDNPDGWVMLSFISDPRTGLGRYTDFRISNHMLMLKLVEWIRTHSIDEILEQGDVRERAVRYWEHETFFRRMVERTVTIRDNVIVLDLRGENEIYTGNRFSIYTLYPECNISVQVVWGKDKENVTLAVGHSIFNRTSKTDVGRLMLDYGGGGHKQVGTCQVATQDADRVLEEIIVRINSDG